ncbi:MAG: type VI secretion system-associated protein TagO, partial [Aeromonadaceae bacterium]
MATCALRPSLLLLVSVVWVTPLPGADTASGERVTQAQWLQCHDMMWPVSRLACYDSLATRLHTDGADQPAKAAAINTANRSRTASWQAIRAQERRRSPEDPPFLLQRHDAEASL